ncbi:adenylate kinase [archaeon CG10_big_fil_rev_8_21_14_0_10_43_11]|nr:MAG: adenylate kinase [archaeon CG10_big_fil_rev_8_21_14_0_10_43_11]
MNIILLGPPGAGKGTQAQLLCDYLCIPHISTGDMLRAAVHEGSTVGYNIKNLLDAGGLVLDSIIIELVKERIAKPDCVSGFLFDGFPRTITQAEALDTQGITIDSVIELDVPDSEILLRMSGRRVHAASGRVYHAVFNPPRVADYDDVTGEPLILRDDDREQIVRERLAIYHQQTARLVDFYQEKQKQSRTHFFKINGVGDIHQIHERTLSALEI